MIYKHLRDNLIYFIEAVGFVKVGQLVSLFSDEADKNTIQQALSQLVRSCVFKQDGDLIISGREVKIVDSFAKRRIKALWVVSSIGSKQIIDLSRLSFPRCFLILLKDDRAIELSSCETVQEAWQAQVRYENEKISNGEDKIVRTVLVPSRDVGEELKNFYFNNFCLLDKERKPIFYTWERG
ncbi:MAG: DUF5697 family protein [Clostridiales bacterium]|nr:hypothetical protein [Clostridiales bacterium]MDU7244144.1 DUF5697 family protein [Clostridiales bacterium]